ncbi:MAG: hypothetical protein DWQ02_19015 [Bacteroidetes bacterium]|nr:MAG: hypothetical protein DWQ02_19015 [Bacteroidota bacterium]
MIRSYQLAGTIKINHEYYQGNNFHDLNIVPTPDTQRYLDHYGIQIKLDGDRFSIYTRSQNPNNPLTENLPALTFYLLLNNVLFINFTDLPLSAENKTLLFKSEPGKTNLSMDYYAGISDQVDFLPMAFAYQLDSEVKDTFFIVDESGKQYQEEIKIVGNTVQIDMSAHESGYYELWAGETILTRLFLSSQQFSVLPLGAIVISMENLSHEGEPVEYEINFDSRKSIWRYFIINSSSNTGLQGLSITSSDPEQTFFEEQEEVILQNGQKAKAFYSNPSKPIPFKQQQEEKYTLSITSPQLELHLPYPSVESLQVVNTEDGIQIYSHIYVYV